MIRKITESELAENSVASLPTRPSLPSLYSGRSLGAKELREAFDKLPRLLATRFNALIEGLGLYKEGEALDSLADALATGLSEGHSLADLFADIKNGAFCEYMQADGERTLAQVLSSLQAALDEGLKYTVAEIGTGDIVTSVEGINGDILVRKSLHSSALAQKKEQDSLKEELAVLKAQSAKASRVKRVEARVSNVEELLCGSLLSYETDEDISYGSHVPKNALSYAVIDKLGSITPFASGENLFPSHFPLVSHTPEDSALYPGVVSQKNGTVTFSDGSFDPGAVRITLFDGTLERGRYLLSAPNINGISYSVHFKSGEEILRSVELFGESTDDFFLLTEGADGARIELKVTDSAVSGSITPTLKKQSLTLSPVSAVRVTEKNLLPGDIYRVGSWQTRTNESGVVFLDYHLNKCLPKLGKYTLSLKYDTLQWDKRILSLYRSIDGGKTWIPAADESTAYIVANAIDRLPKTFDVREGEMWRLTLYPATAETLSLLSDIQLEAGEAATDYEAYTEKIYPLPEELTALDGFAYGVGESVYNYVDFEKSIYEKIINMRDYTEGDMDYAALKTDGIKTLGIMYGGEFPLSDTAAAFALLPVTAGGAVYFENAQSAPVPFTVTYQTMNTEKGEIT